MTYEPLAPRITKTTAVAAIKARFPDTESLLQRFELAKNQANQWDGERDGLREAVKTIPPGLYGRTALSWSSTAAVLYPNASGKYQLECCLQTSIPRFITLEENDGIIAFQVEELIKTPEDFLELILHHLQKGKEHLLDVLAGSYIGAGKILSNGSLYEKKGADKSTISVMPDEGKEG